MARPLRLEFAGALYHVTARGDGREAIYLCDDDRIQYLDVLAQVCERFNWYCHAYCLMGNHYHLLIETPYPNLSKGMRQLNGVYTQRFNRTHGRVGHVFQGRFKAILVQKESYLLELARYIVLNPVRAQMVPGAIDWPWSSYHATAGITDVPDWLITDGLLSAFGERRTAAIDAYKQFVAQGRGQPSPWARLKNQIYLGDDKFVEALLKQIDPDSDLHEIPAPQRRNMRRSLTYYDQRGENRDAAIGLAYGSGAYTLRQLGDYYGLHPSRVGRIVEKARDSLRSSAADVVAEMSKSNGQPDETTIRDWVRKKLVLVRNLKTGARGELIFDINASYKGLDRKMVEKYIALATEGWAKRGVVMKVKLLEGTTYESLNAPLRFEPCTECSHEIQGVATGPVIAIDPKNIRPDVAQHEFGHWMGLGHQRNETLSIMSYSARRAIRKLDADRLRNCYLNAACGWR